MTKLFNSNLKSKLETCHEVESKETLRTRIDSFYNRYKENRRERSVRSFKKKENRLNRPQQSSVDETERDRKPEVENINQTSTQVRNVGGESDECSTKEKQPLSGTSPEASAQEKQPLVRELDKSSTLSETTDYHSDGNGGKYPDDLLDVCLHIEQTERDEEIARQLQAELEMEEMNERLRQAADDAEIAKTLWEEQHR
jgi:uncharacterized protein with von Willebrand factor type A (vWA) domain